MAHVYIDSNAVGSGTGADWANAYTTLGAALSAKAAGDNFWVAHDHAESAASAKTLTSPGTAAAPCTVICVNKGGSVPPVAADLATTATVATTGANNITIAGGPCYYYGITFTAGSGAVDTTINLSGTWLIFVACLLHDGGSNTGFTILQTSRYVELVNTPIRFGATGDQIVNRGGTFIWRDTANAIHPSGSVPTTLFTSSSPTPGFTLLDNLDLSAAGSGKTIFGTFSQARKYLMRRCRLGASVTIAATPPNPDGGDVDVVQCDSGAVNYRNERYKYAGTETTETTIVRTGGASDGATPFARKIVTTANAEWTFPFESLSVVIWNETTGSPITATIHGVWGGGAVPNNDEIWAEARYLGNSSYPLGSLATCGKASYLATASALTSDGSTWGGSATAFKMEITFTPQMKGPIEIVIKAAKASETFYIDPVPEISGVTVSRTYAMPLAAFANELGGAGGGLLAHPGMRGGFL